ncbi:MAG: FecR domain-containing protein [Bacteroidales bacterium]|nr:FecR domain-containing protein [Bacteroidales bacterium]
MEKEKELRFVVSNYQEGRLDPEKAKMEFRRAHSSSASYTKVLAWALPVAAALVFSILFWNHWKNSWTEYGDASTKSEVMLSDGTQVSLSEGSLLKLQPHLNPRKVVVEGRAYFQVARDEAHPFEVFLEGKGYVKVLGTKFEVLTGERPEVNVTEGKVFFAEKPGSEGLVLVKGMSAVLEDELPALSFVYEDAALEAVLEDLGSYFGRTLHCDAAGRRLTASFRADSLENIIAAIEAALDLTIELD